VDYYELAKAIMKRSKIMYDQAKNEVDFNREAALADAAVAKALKIVSEEILEQAERKAKESR
jgi:hypothetical protein